MVGPGTDPLADTLRTDAASGQSASTVEDRRLRASVKAKLFGADTTAPVLIGRYRLLDKIGEGGMGMVYVAHDDELERRVAIKILHPDGSGDPKRLLREARSMARLSHPHIAAVYDVGVYDDDVYVAMEYVEGPSLRTWLASARPWSERCAVLLQAAEGLRAAHDAGVVHRDFKPDNVIVGNDGRVRVLDFGLAKIAPEMIDTSSDASMTDAGKLLGTPRYMAPEQMRAQRAGPAADQFAFCVTAYEAAYGSRPFGGDVFAEVAAAVLREDPREPPPIADVPAALWPVLRRGLARAPEDRHPDMMALLSALREVDQAIPATWSTPAPALADDRERARLALATAYAHDRVSSEELDARLERLESAADAAAIAVLVGDLQPSVPPPPAAALVPVAAMPPAHRAARILSLFSSAERRGHWSPAPHNRIITAFGATEIDLREANLPAEGIELEVAVMFGSVEILVPPGMRVELECTAVLGSAEQDEPSAPPDPQRPRVLVTGFVAFGSVEVRERLPGEGGWRAWKRRRAAQKALRQAARTALPPRSDD